MKKRLAVTGVLLLLAGFLAASGQVQAAAREALRLCADTLIPALFPFFVLSVLLCRLGLPELLGRWLGGGAGASALLMGLLGGYPLGAGFVAELYASGRIGKREGERLLAYCNNSGPAFILGAAGVGVFGSTKAGLVLYAVHIAAAILTGLLFSGEREAGETLPSPSPETALATAFPDAVREAVPAVLNVCGFVVFFSTVAALAEAGGFLSALCLRLARVFSADPRAIRGFLLGLLELGNGIGALRGLALTPGNLALTAFLLGFGGVSVHCQTAAVISRAQLKSALHFAGRSCAAVLSAILAYAAGCILF